ncbi:MAG TPA: galactose mutarotase [Bacteroidetes bacterium]|nr:galactose mutarotase [Bacteroidota bacterium]
MSSTARYLIFAFLSIFVFAACRPNSPEAGKQKEKTASPNAHPGIEKTVFGTFPDGDTAYLYTLRNANGMEVQVTDFGGIITSIKVPDRNGKLEEVVLGFDSLDDYLNDQQYFGAIIGRYANRIANGSFSLDGKEYKLPTNDGPNTLHGGTDGFNKYLWMAEIKERPREATLSLYRTSPDGEEGFPGNLQVQVEYTLNNKDELRIFYAAIAEAPTVVNLTNHCYFNLSGDASKPILKHELQINADAYTPVNGQMVPTGEIAAVAATPFDFRSAKTIGKDIGAANQQLKYGSGYNHNFVLNKAPEDMGPQLAATVYEPNSGRVLEVLTTEPGMQFYTGNQLEKTKGKGGVVYGKHAGFCLQTQHFPDSPNHENFPSTVVKPGRTFRTTTIFRFLVK